MAVERVEVLFENICVRIERILSFGVVSPQEYWYDQDMVEMVFVLKGSGIIELADKEISLKADDYYLIQPHVKHRVKYTSEDCVWLCVYVKK